MPTQLVDRTDSPSCLITCSVLVKNKAFYPENISGESPRVCESVSLQSTGYIRCRVRYVKSGINNIHGLEMAPDCPVVLVYLSNQTLLSIFAMCRLNYSHFQTAQQKAGVGLSEVQDV